MDDKILDKWLESHQAPTPSADLNARILAAVTSKVQANDNHRAFTRRFLPIAATILAVSMIGITGINTVNDKNIETETALWQEAALDLGFDEIYIWVESDDIATQ